MIPILLVVIIVLLSAIILWPKKAKKNTTNEELVVQFLDSLKNKPKRSYKERSSVQLIELKGVWYNDRGRRDAFKEVSEGDSVVVRFDFGNAYDRNAIGVYTNTGGLIGFIPKNNKQAIGALRRRDNRIAKIIKKDDGKTQWEKGIKIELSFD
jgi:hypothetical protein